MILHDKTRRILRGMEDAAREEHVVALGEAMRLESMGRFHGAAQQYVQAMDHAFRLEMLATILGDKSPNGGDDGDV